MFTQTTLTKKNTKRNKRSKTISKDLNKNLRSINGNGHERTITGGHIPHGRRKKTEAKGKLNLPAITPWKVILTSFLIGICGILYITHVFSTQQILMEVQQLENEFNKVNRVHTERRLEYDRMVGPKEIYQRAQEQGLINAGPADQIIILKK